ncbi:M42 family metallopeptidase [Caldivirga maquilingensis]|uniref:Cellulase n=1 Tax=Caldivirga maquilingensis (strain ATCC 700844 / DSM 13496 / JCM 10307 / IC-167) TaxID=397948 RepID=A8MAL9_CALMQ|nr:M42 family metallopeptidase [Caldivirga maquilingensis]ABW01055.1 Cellulase [Caldivirga maquilingensis IC-167]
MDAATLSKLTLEIGPSGFEDRVIRTIISMIRNRVDEVNVDNMGNLIARIGNGPFKLMISAHADEVGVMVSHIDQRGFIKVVPIGGIDPWVMIEQELVFMGRNGDIYGTVGVDPPHLRRDKPPSRFEELYVDAGFTSNDEAFKAGILPGVAGTFAASFRERGSVVIGKALDNRVGCSVLVDLAEEAGGMVTGDLSLYLVWNTQEEVGLRGINAAVNAINPNMAIVVETTVAADVPTNPENEWITRIGNGAAIRALDRSMITNPRLLSAVLELASSRGIKYQVQVNPYGGTDAGAIHVHGTGVPTVVVSTPARYIHTPHSVVNLSDVEQVKSMITLIVREHAELSRVMRIQA